MFSQNLLDGSNQPRLHMPSNGRPNENNIKLISEVLVASSSTSNSFQLSNIKDEEPTAPGFGQRAESPSRQSESNLSLASTPAPRLLLPASIGRAVVASDNDVSNGFVKDGKMLPYVFEANDAGVRKRSSKILPVCGVCGKRFVCVTTMKRHLVTHTGEKPFSCKVCGKQYTQKGNLRVHERTHRNDRPFECNICHQKFYRKEPMQKHQWRQHGIVHSKSRPLTNLPVVTLPTQAAQLSPTSMVTVGNAPPPPPPPPPPNDQEINDMDNEEAQDYSNHVEPAVVAVADMVEEEEDQYPTPPMAHASERSGSLVRFQFSKLSQKYDPSMYTLNRDDDDQASQLMPPKAHSNVYSSAVEALQRASEDDSDNVVNLSAFNYSQVPKLPPAEASVCEFTHAKSTSVPAPLDIPSNGHRNEDGSETDMTSKLPEIASNSLQAIKVPSEQTEEVDHPQPMKLKVKLAQAYQREMLEFRDKEQEREEGGRELGAGPNLMQTLDSNMSVMKLQSSSSSSDASTPPLAKEKEQDDQQVDGLPDDQDVNQRETVECHCKSCGSTVLVVDPYNFRCNTCNVKHTSVPTHLIADPLQCIGCCQVFPHKPALKAHQTRAEKERPFRCCKCGYGFRQKAHLQKHQWRIHRRKLESDPSVKEAEALFQAMKDPPSGSTAPSEEDVKKVTIQDIINHGVEHGLRLEQGAYSGGNKTSSKYFSDVLGMEFQGPSAGKKVKLQHPNIDIEAEEPAEESEHSPRKSPSGTKEQPLDLSPVKVANGRSDSANLDSRKLHNLIASIPFNEPEESRGEMVDRSVISLVPEDEPISYARPVPTSKLVQLENNPLLSQPPIGGSSAVDSDLALVVSPTLKKLAIPTSHKTLPPISGLQKPMSYNRNLLPILTDHVDHDQSRSFQKHDTVSKNLLLPSDVAHGNHGDKLRSKLLGAPCHNVRTV